MKKLLKFFKKIPTRYITIAAILATLASFIAVSATFAVFQTTVVGSGETPISAWNFKVKINGDYSKDDGVEDSLVTDVRLAGGDDYSWASNVPNDLKNIDPDTDYEDLPLALQAEYPTEESYTAYRVQNHLYNRDENAVLPDYLLAPGTSGYLPVEIDGSASHGSIIVTVSAYFGDLPKNSFEFYDNLGNRLEISTAEGFIPTSELAETKNKADEDVQQRDIGIYSVVSYQYYISYVEMAQWAKMTGDKFIDIGLRWVWLDNGTNQNYDLSHLYGEVRVTGMQVTNANQIGTIRSINFADGVADVDEENDNVVNIMMTALSDGDVLRPESETFILDVNDRYTIGDAMITISPKSTNSRVVLGTNRREIDYSTINKYNLTINNVIGSSPAVDVDAYISGDFAYSLSDINASNVNAATLAGNMNDILAAHDGANTMHDALKTIIANKASTDFAANYSAVATIQDLVALIDSASKDANEDVLWNSQKNRFVFAKDGEEVLLENVKAADLTKKYNFFKVYSTYPTTQTYSIYLAGEAITGAINGLTVGLDVGSNDGITSIAYDRSTATTAQSVLIRTNSFATQVTVNAPLDTIKHYGYAGLVNITSIASHSYGEYGIVGRLDLSTGHVRINRSAIVYQATESAGDASFITKEDGATVYGQNGKKVAGAVDSRDAGSTKDMFVEASGFIESCTHTNTNYVIDGQYIYEVCEHCGYTVVSVITNQVPVKYSVKALKAGSASEYEFIITPIATYRRIDADAEVLSQSGSVVFKSDAEPIIPTPVVDASTTVDNTCEHEFGAMATINYPTTSTTGLGKYTCSKCGFNYNEVIPVETVNPYAIITNTGALTLGNTAATDKVPDMIETAGSASTVVYGASLATGSGSCMTHGKDTTLENVWKYSAVLTAYAEQEIKDYFGDYKTLAYVISFDKDVSYDSGSGNLMLFFGSLNGGQWSATIPVVADFDEAEYASTEMIKIGLIYYAEYLRTSNPTDNAKYTEEYAVNAYDWYSAWQGEEDDDYNEYCEFVSHVVENDYGDATAQAYVEKGQLLAFYNYEAGTEYTFTSDKMLSLDSVLAGSIFSCSAAMLDLDGSNDTITMTVKLYAYKSIDDAVAINKNDRKLANEITFTFKAAED